MGQFVESRKRRKMILNGSSTLQVLLDLLCVLKKKTVRNWNPEIKEEYLGVASVDFLVEFSVSLVDVSDVFVFIVHATSVEVLSLRDLRLKLWMS